MTELNVKYQSELSCFRVIRILKLNSLDLLCDAYQDLFL